MQDRYHKLVAYHLHSNESKHYFLQMSFKEEPQKKVILNVNFF